MVKPLFRILAFVFMLAIPLTVDAASTRPIEISPACDPEFYDVMAARSWLEGKREVEVAQRLILKPDSVLEYSCFDDRLTEMAIGANTMFSDNVFSPVMFPNHPTSVSRPDFMGPPAVSQPDLDIGDPGPNPPGTPNQLFLTGLDTALSQIAYDPQFAFLLQNFSHRYGGGTALTLPASTVCNPMALVWDFMKCQDFDINHFRTLREFTLIDPRNMPIPCNDPNRTSNWLTNFDNAFPDPGDPGAVDAFDTYQPKFDAAAAGGCSEDPIPTGLEVTIGSTTFDDAVCPTPGCYYDGSGGSCQ
ncbi:MAG: hypothetical protein JKY71_06575 [Alphaproteobacteria bacterium]|nr:hypothetical protein [Alphaproteobacteria bacterium]